MRAQEEVSGLGADSSPMLSGQCAEVCAENNTHTCVEETGGALAGGCADILEQVVWGAGPSLCRGQQAPCVPGCEPSLNPCIEHTVWPVQC